MKTLFLVVLIFSSLITFAQESTSFKILKATMISTKKEYSYSSHNIAILIDAYVELTPYKLVVDDDTSTSYHFIKPWDKKEVLEKWVNRNTEAVDDDDVICKLQLTWNKIPNTWVLYIRYESFSLVYNIEVK